MTAHQQTGMEPWQPAGDRPVFRPGRAWLDRHATIYPDAAALGRRLARDLPDLEQIEAYLTDALTAARLEARQ
jgi:hypothetical protein